MYTKLYQNSYIVALITFFIIAVLCYVFQFGWSVKIVNGEVKQRFSWIIPLAIALCVWILWHFILFPPLSSTTGYIISDIPPHFQNGGSVASETKIIPNSMDLENQFMEKAMWV